MNSYDDSLTCEISSDSARLDCPGAEGPPTDIREAGIQLEIVLAEFFVIVDGQFIPVQLQMSFPNKLMNHARDRLA